MSTEEWIGVNVGRLLVGHQGRRIFRGWRFSFVLRIGHGAMIGVHSFLVLRLWIVLDVTDEMMIVVEVIGTTRTGCRGCRCGCDGGVGIFGRGIVASIVVGRMH